MLLSIQPAPVSGHLKQKLNFAAYFLVFGKRVLRMEAEHFKFKMQVWAGLQLEKQLQKAPFCSGG